MNVLMPPREELLEKYQKESSNKIAEKYGVTGRTVRNWLERCGIERRVQKPPREELLEKYDLKGLKKLGKEYEVRPRTIANWLESYGIEINHNRLKIQTFSKKSGRICNPKKNNQSATYREIRNSDDLTLEDFFNDIKPLVDFYNSLFDDNRTGVILKLNRRMSEGKGRSKQIYGFLHEHYLEIHRFLREDFSQ